TCTGRSTPLAYGCSPATATGAATASARASPSTASARPAASRPSASRAPTPTSSRSTCAASTASSRAPTRSCPSTTDTGRSRTAPSAAATGGRRDEALARRHERLRVRRVDRLVLSRGAAGRAAARVLRGAPARRRDQQPLLPHAQGGRARGLGGAGGAGLPLR